MSLGTPSRACTGSGWPLPHAAHALRGSALLLLATWLPMLAGCGSAAEDTSDRDAVKTESAGAASGAAGGGRAGSSGRATGAMAGMQAASEPGTFTHIYEHVLTNCKVAMCHGSGVAGLDMSSRDAAFASLVDHAPNPDGDCAEFPSARVVPGSTDDSLLFLKVNATKAPCGMHMPAGGQLSAAARMEIAQWITDGAQDN